jgi:hypothetical protein
MKILYTANALTTHNLNARPGRISMRQLDGVPGQRLEDEARDAQAASPETPRHLDALSAANERLPEIDTRSQATTANEEASDLQDCLAQVVRSRNILVEQLNQAVQALDRAEQNRAAAATTAAHHRAQQEAELAAAKAEAATVRESLERQLANAYDRAADANAAAERLARREAELAKDAEAHQNLQRRFSAAFTLLQEQDADLEATTKRLTKREAELAEATETRLSLERQLAEAESALGESVRRAADDRATAIEQAAQRQSDFEAVLREEVAKYVEAEARHASAMTTAAAQRGEQEARHEARMAEVVAARVAVSRQLHETTAALDRARQDHLANATAAAERLAEQEATLREGTAARQMLEGQLADARSALQAAEHRAAAERLAAGERAAEREAEFVARLDQEAATRERLKQALTGASNKVAETETAIRDAEHRHASHITTVTARFADQQVQFETRLSEAVAARDLIDQRLREVEVSFERSRQEAAVDAAAAAERLARLEVQQVEARANLQMLEGQLADANAALQAAEQRAAAERLTAEQQAAQRQAEFEAAIERETAGRHAVEQDLATSQQKLAESESALRNAEERHVSDMTSAAAQFAERKIEFETLLTQATAVKDALDRRLREAEATLERIHDERRAEAIAVAEQLTQLESALAKATELVVSERVASAERAAERQSEFEAALRDATAQHTKEMTSASNELSEQRSQYTTRLAEVTTAREIVSQQLHDTETTLARIRQERDAERTATLQQSAQRRAEFDAELAREVEARTIVERDLAETRLAADQTRQALLEQSAALSAEMRELEVRLTQELARERAEYEGKLADASENFERIRQANEVELARINRLVAERDGQLKDKAARHALSQEAARQALANLENELRAAVTAHRQQVEQLQSDLKAVTRDFEETRSHRDAVQIEADRVPQLTNQLEASRAEGRQQFEGSPIGILRCSDAGVLKEANRALITGLGYRTVDQLRALGSAASVFESPDDLRWLIEHCERTPSESVDCTWKKKDGSRLIMRVRALRLSADVVEIVAEDLTTLRAVEERLRQSQRMEAVGRLASEVADTCDILLRNVSQDGEQWLATVNTAQRHQGESILGEVTRAATFLRQLSVYGEKQASALAAVDVNTVLRDMAPVLKRVAGDDIELVLPKKLFALNVDVDVERVERVLVNIAAYGRARMPSGGRLIIELARVVVGLDFVAKYPNVRQGAHALISVAEVRRAAPAESPTGSEPVEATAIAATSQRPGVDLGALQTLIGDCGGHLWMKAEPGGDMEVKIHLPLRSADASRSAGVFSSARGRSIGAWFQS